MGSRTMRSRGGDGGCCGSTQCQASESRRRRIRAHSAAGCIKRLDSLHVIAIELEVEHADVLLQPLEPNRLRNDDEPVVEMPADDDLRRRFPMLGGDLDKRGLAQ